MKYRLLFGMLLVSSLMMAQVGINTEYPKATMEITVSSTTTNSEPQGLLIPRMTADKLKSMTESASINMSQNSMLVYVTDSFTNNSDKNGVYELVEDTGFYYYKGNSNFDNSRWIPLNLAVPKQFYMPSVVLPTNSQNLPSYVSYDTNSEKYTIDLHQEYKKQFTGSSSDTSFKSTGATKLISYSEKQLEYFITYYDDSVYQIVKLTDTGVLEYKIKSSGTLTEQTYMNIVFKVK